VKSAAEIIERATSQDGMGVYDWLAIAIGLSEWRYECGRYSVKTPSMLLALIYETLGEEVVCSSPTLARWLQNAAEMKMRNELGSFLFALQWTSTMPTFEMEQFFGRGAGGLKKDASTMAWIISSAVRLLGNVISAKAPGGILGGLTRLAERLRYGVDDRGLILAKELKIDREFIRRLGDGGIESCEALMAADMGAVSAIVPKTILNKILNWRKNYRGDSDIKATNNSGPELKQRIVFSGRNEKLKNEVVIDGISIWLQPRLYVYIQKLWSAYQNGSPWVPKEGLDIGPYQAKYISKLKKQLSDAGAKLEIESNGRGGYALRI
jgi:hypothetical protein